MSVNYFKAKPTNYEKGAHDCPGHCHNQFKNLPEAKLIEAI